MEDVAYWLVPGSLLSLFLVEPKTTSLGMAPPTVGWVLSHHSLFKKVPYKLAYSLVFGRRYLN